MPPRIEAAKWIDLVEDELIEDRLDGPLLGQGVRQPGQVVVADRDAQQFRGSDDAIDRA
jgi:hypothetical protein